MFWLREVAGWALIAVGLALLSSSTMLLYRKELIEGAALTLSGIMVFRGGIQLVKVATAARIVLWAQQERTQSPR